MSTEPCWAMNNNGAVEADDAADSEGLSWFMGLLRQMMTEVMAGEAPGRLAGPGSGPGPGPGHRG